MTTGDHKPLIPTSGVGLCHGTIIDHSPHLSVPELEQRYRQPRDPVGRSHWQIIWLLAQQTPTAEVACFTGYSPTWVREIARRYREAGLAGLGDRRHGNLGGALLLSPDQQKELRAALSGPPPAGGLWTCCKVAAWIGATIGRPVAEVRGWEYLRPLGFKPQWPRPRETRADPKAQATFKKGSLQAAVDTVATAHPQANVSV